MLQKRKKKKEREKKNLNNPTRKLKIDLLLLAHHTYQGVGVEDEFPAAHS